MLALSPTGFKIAAMSLPEARLLSSFVVCKDIQVEGRVRLKILDGIIERQIGNGKRYMLMDKYNLISTPM